MASKKKPVQYVLCLRTCNADLTSYGGFQWPKKGRVKCNDWDSRPVCGGGLHGLAWGETTDSSLLDWSESARWLVVKVRADEIVKIDDSKVKFPRGEVVHVGDRVSATAYLIATGGHGYRVTGGTATAGDRGTATAGDSGTATAGDSGTATAGVRGTATAGDRGTATAGYGGTATAGDSGTATAGYGGTATAGDRGTATAGYGGTATAGYGGTATAGDRGTATAGVRGTVVVTWYDSARQKYRLVIAEIGENGFEPNVPYRADAGRLVRVPDAEWTDKQRAHFEATRGK